MKRVGKKGARSARGWDKSMSKKLDSLCLAASVDQVEAVALEYDDGSSYVVRDEAAGLQNTEYALGWTDGEGERLTLVFNRLVDPARVTAVAVDGVRYPVE